MLAIQADGYLRWQPVFETGSATSMPLAIESTWNRSSGSGPGHGVADVKIRHELMIAGAIEYFVGHQRDLRRQREVFQRVRKA